jgi:hypothetical protein
MVIKGLMETTLRSLDKGKEVNNDSINKWRQSKKVHWLVLR